MPTGSDSTFFCKGRIGMEFLFPGIFQKQLAQSSLNEEMSLLLCCLIQAITRANSEGDSVPGEGKIYILGWNMKIMLLMRAVHDKNQIMKPKRMGMVEMQSTCCKGQLHKKWEIPNCLCDYAKAQTIEQIN